MEHANSTPGTPAAHSCLATALCGFSALVLVLLGLIAALLQLLAYMNFRFQHSGHLLLFLVGWATVGCCFYSAYRLASDPGYQRLWFAVLAGGMLTLDAWLFSLNEGLFH